MKQNLLIVDILLRTAIKCWYMSVKRRRNKQENTKHDTTFFHITQCIACRRSVFTGYQRVKEKRTTYHQLFRPYGGNRNSTDHASHRVPMPGIVLSSANISIQFLFALSSLYVRGVNLLNTK